MTSSKLKKSDQHTHDMTQIEGDHIDDRVGAVPGPDSVNRRVSGPGTEPGSVPGLARLKWAICKRGLCLIPLWCTCACVMAERRFNAHADVEQSDAGVAWKTAPVE